VSPQAEGQQDEQGDKMAGRDNEQHGSAASAQATDKVRAAPACGGEQAQAGGSGGIHAYRDIRAEG
jgi:hypothetical protein